MKNCRGWNSWSEAGGIFPPHPHDLRDCRAMVLCFAYAVCTCTFADRCRLMHSWWYNTYVRTYTCILLGIVGAGGGFVNYIVCWRAFRHHHDVHTCTCVRTHTLHANSAGMHTFTCMYMHICTCMHCTCTCYKILYYIKSYSQGLWSCVRFHMTFPGLLQKVAVHWRAMWRKM